MNYISYRNHINQLKFYIYKNKLEMKFYRLTLFSKDKLLVYYNNNRITINL